MHQHVNDLTKLVNDVAHRVIADPSTLSQARAVIYAARTMIYARGQEARFLDRTPYFSSKPGTAKSRSKGGGGFTV